MSAVLIAVLALTSPPDEGSQPTAQASPSAASKEAEPKPDVTLRSGPELRDAVRAALREWANVSDEDADRAACEFLILFQELQVDDKLATRQRNEFKTKVRSRLLKLSQRITYRVAVERRLEKEAEDKKPDSIKKPEEKPEHLAQQFGGFGAGGGMGGPMGGGGPAWGRGAGGGFGGGAGGFQRVPDHGQELVELIQATVAPQSWDVNGGPGSIYYWYPGKCLVVRQTDEVHGEIGGVLEQLGRAQR